MGKQAEIVQATEGDNWFARNKSKDRSDDVVLQEILENPRIQPTSILEIGCSTGWRLQRLRERFRDAECRGCDLSWEAINEGRKKYTKLGLRVAGAASTGYPSGIFDLVIAGFFLYLVDREELFTVVAEIDRLLKDKGALVIYDFSPTEPHSRDYAHDARLTTYKMGYHQLFLANPSYKLGQFKIWGQPEARESVYTLYKDHEAGWPRKA